VFTQILCLCFQDFADLYDDWYDMKGPRIPSNREDCTSNLSKQVKRGTTQYIFLQSEASSELAESAYSDATLHDFLSTSSFPEQDRSISLGKSPGSLLTDRRFFLGTDEAEERRKACHQVVEVLESMLGLEHLYPVNASYIEENHQPHISYKGLKPSMREVTVSWIVEVCLEHMCSQDTLHLAIKTLDRFLSSTVSFPPSKLQLLAVACLWVASKHEDFIRPTALQLTDIAANSFTTRDLLEMEANVLSVTDFRLASPTVATFLTILNQALPMTHDVFAMAAYLAEVSVLDFALVGVPPSELAKACLLLAASHFQNHAAIDGLHLILPNIIISHESLVWKKLTRVYAQALGPVDLVKSNPYFSPLYFPIHEKYSSTEWNRISLVTPFRMFY
jgi:hypothetical protein